MNRQNKQLVIDALKNDFTHSKGSFLVGVKGLTVVQLQSLRRGLREHGGSMKVAKNTLVRRAVQDIPGAEELAPLCNQQLAVVFAKDELSGVAKAIYDVAKQHENLTIVAGCFDGAVVGQDKVKYLAKLPPRDQLLAQLCATIAAPITSHVRLLGQVPAAFVRLLGQLPGAQG